MKINKVFFTLVAVNALFITLAYAQNDPQEEPKIHHQRVKNSTLTLEPSLTMQTKNDQGIPGNIGTRFSLADVSKGPFANFRAYYSYFSDEQTEWRLLLAPLTVHLNGKLSQAVRFQNSTFAPDASTRFLYKFNSYRLTWAKHYKEDNNWTWAIGFTGKIREAEVRLEQGALVESKTDLGFVPLLNFQARYQKPDQAWGFRFDFDGLAAPQGRAFDILLAGTYHFQNQNSVYLGYRTIEGGADNEIVYNFAWFNSLVLGVNWLF